MGLKKTRKRARHRKRNPRTQKPRIQEIVQTNSTFDPVENGWNGRCFYCGRPIFVSSKSETIASVEHIRPRSRGGTNDLKNLALACVNCNNEKGRNADRKAPDEYFDKLLARRLEQWRESVV